MGPIVIRYPDGFDVRWPRPVLLYENSVGEVVVFPLYKPHDVTQPMFVKFIGRLKMCGHPVLGAYTPLISAVSTERDDKHYWAFSSPSFLSDRKFESLEKAVAAWKATCP